MTTIDTYIKQKNSPQKEILQKLREIILETFPDATEEMKWGVPNFHNGRFYIVALKDHVNIGFSIKGLSEEELALVEGTGKTMRHLKIRTVQEINKENIVALLTLVAEKT